MKFIATSDWHIGNMFHGNDRLPEHRHFFAWLIDRIRDEQPDALLVAGDVFDNGNPSANAQTLYYGFLAEITQQFPSLRIIITAGNHDSATRLEAPRALLEKYNVTIRGNVHRRWEEGEWRLDYDDLIIPVENAEGERMVVIAVPYLRADITGNRAYSAGVNEFLENVYNRARELYGDTPIVMMTHLYVTGAEIAAKDASEKILIGGEEEVNIADCKITPAYLTCGHIHKRQKVRGLSNARYSGSVLPMSFAEINYTHGVDLVTIEEGGEIDVRQLVYTPQHRLRIIPEGDEELSPAKIKSLIKKQLPERVDGKLSDNFEYVTVKVTMKNNEADAIHEIEQLFETKNAVLCKLTRLVPQLDLTTVSGTRKITSVDDILSRDPLEVLEEAFAIRHNKPLTDTQRTLLRNLL